MRLYLTSYIDEQNDNVHQRVHHGTQADASRSRKELKREGMLNIETKEVDVPTDKAGLMGYLNRLAG